MSNNIKKFSPYDTGMLRNIMAMSEMDVVMVMVDKGDIEYLDDQRNVKRAFDMPKGKNMKAAERRKRTYHKQQQREKKYRDLGYPIERFSASERGKMREGVGMFPETTHMNSMYNRNCFNSGMRGYRKEGKSITTQQAISMMEHERWLDEQERIAAEEEYEYIMTFLYVDDLKDSICWLNNQLEYSNARLHQMMESIKELNDSITSMRQEKERLIEKIKKEEEWLEAHKK